MKITPNQINQGSGLARHTKSLVRKKKTTELGQQVIHEERRLVDFSLHSCQTADELDTVYREQSKSRDALRAFYFSNSFAKKKRRLELIKAKYHCKLAAEERRFSGSKKPIMMIGDRGYGTGSCIKNHQRFGGPWKGKLHGRYTTTLVTNEHNSSQTCVFCFKKLSHPHTRTADGSIKITNGAFICLNNSCPNKFVVVSRDKLSALAIGLAGAAQLIFGVTFPCFDPHSTTEKIQKFKKSALAFPTQIARRLALGGGNTL